MHHTEGISGPNSFYLCSQRDSEDEPGSSPEGVYRKTDTMHMHIRIHFLCGTNLIKLPEKEQIIHIVFSFVVFF